MSLATAQEHGEIPSGSGLLLYLFSVFWIGEAGQILFLEFSKDGPADNRDKFTYSASANKPVILYVFPVARCLSVIGSLNPTSKCFLKLVNSFLCSGV